MSCLLFVRLQMTQRLPIQNLLSSDLKAHAPATSDEIRANQ
jgi:hypothetical protein